MKDFISALQFLTTIRIAKLAVSSTEEFARSMLYFPLVGLLIGGLLTAIGYGAAIRLTPGVVGAVILVTEIMLSGGLHLDGYMDTMDGIFSGRPREKILEIMKDSRVGAHSVIAVGGLFILKYALLVEAVSLNLWPVIVLMPALGRFTQGIGTALFPYARPEGLGKGFAQFFSWRHLAITGVYTAGAAYLLLNWRGLVLWGAVALWGWVFARFVTGRIGGLTGDVYGAISELSELAALLFAVLAV